MPKTHITLFVEPEILVKVDEFARAYNVSRAEIIRRCVAETLQGKKPKAEAAKIGFAPAKTEPIPAAKKKTGDIFDEHLPPI